LKPSIGEFGRECRAAIVTEVNAEHASTGGKLLPLVGLCVLNPTGQFFNRDVKPDQGTETHTPGISHLCGARLYRGGTWHWPERVG
jgi:hypothetical protein